MQYGLSDEQEMIVSTVRRFVETEIYPHEELVERTGEVPEEIAAEIKRKTLELGFYACNFPESVGCAGLSHVDFALVERELGRGSMALNHFFGRPQNILMACEGEQVDRYLMPAVRGERMDALAMTEPGAGSDVRGMKCAAVRDGGDWVVNGTKHFISGADHADFIIVFIATGEDATPKGPKKRITAFLVDRGTPGFTIRDGYKSVSHRGYKNMILDFDDCRLPDTQVLGEVDGGFDVMNTWLYATRITVATMSVGRARRVFDYALSYAAEREQFGQPIAGFQAIQHLLSESQVDVSALAELCRSALEEWSTGDASELAKAAKALAGRAGLAVAQRALQCFGAIGFTDEHQHHRYSRRIHTLDAILGSHYALRRELGDALIESGHAPRGLRVWRSV